MRLLYYRVWTFLWLILCCYFFFQMDHTNLCISSTFSLQYQLHQAQGFLLLFLLFLAFISFIDYIAIWHLEKINRSTGFFSAQSKNNLIKWLGISSSLSFLGLDRFLKISLYYMENAFLEALLKAWMETLLPLNSEG